MDLDFVAHAEEEYRSIYHSGKPEEVDSARFRLVWALVHSTSRKHQKRGYDIAQQKLQDDNKDAKEYRYFAAVACYNMGRYVEARKEVTTLLKDHPEFRQAAVLRGLADDAIVREGLVGVGIGAAAVGAALVVGALLGGRK